MALKAHDSSWWSVVSPSALRTPVPDELLLFNVFRAIGKWGVAGHQVRRYGVDLINQISAKYSQYLLDTVLYFALYSNPPASQAILNTLILSR